MRILVDITHPAHVHFFKHAIWKWQEHGHDVLLTSRDKDVALQLLDSYGLDHTNLGPARSGLAGLSQELLVRGGKLLRIVRRRRPDVMVGIAATFIAPVGRLTGTPVILFTDTENAKISNALAFPCAQVIVTPNCYRKPVVRKGVAYKGYHELAYLRPEYFTPDPGVLDELRLKRGEPFVIVRFVSWGAAHDVGHSGLSLESKREAVREFAKYAKVFITSEQVLPPDLEPYRIRIAPERIHHALNYATLFYGEGATMASECAVLGTPAIFLNDAGTGYLDEQENLYGLAFNFRETAKDQQRSIQKGVEILQTAGVDTVWAERREQLLEDTIDVTGLIVDLVEDYVEKNGSGRREKDFAFSPRRFGREPVPAESASP